MEASMSDITLPHKVFYYLRRRIINFVITKNVFKSIKCKKVNYPSTFE